MRNPAVPYAQRWENYWSAVTRDRTRVVWDAPAEEGVAFDWPNIERHTNRALPMVHLGCGHGRQTAFLADHFPRTIGVDISPSAIARARTDNPHERVEYRVFDAADPAPIAALHDELGDCNVYIRGVLHQLADDQQGSYLASALRLIGREGTLSVLELRRGAEQIFFPMVKLGLLSFLRPVLDNGIEPRGITQQRLRELLDDATHEVLESTPTVLIRLSLTRTMGFKVPAWHMAIRRRAE
jgi:SAM-dependent methyltransferase